MSKKYTKEALKEAYKEHIIEYMQDNGYDDEIGLDEETAITILKQRMDENGMRVLRWIDKKNFDANHDYFYFDAYGYLYSSNSPVSEEFSLKNIKNDFSNWLRESRYAEQYK